MNLPNVSIVIPARNEGLNIKRLLTTLLQSKRRNFVLHEILIISDGSSDNTVTEAESLHSPLVRVISHAQSKGKIARLNEAFESLQDDIIVQFDGDVVLPEDTIVERMVEPFLNNEKIAMVCGWHRPLPAKGFIGKMGVFGALAWERAVALLGDAGDLYYSVGNIRAFSKAAYENLVIPQATGGRYPKSCKLIPSGIMMV